MYNMTIVLQRQAILTVLLAKLDSIYVVYLMVLKCELNVYDTSNKFSINQHLQLFLMYCHQNDLIGLKIFYF